MPASKEISPVFGAGAQLQSHASKPMVQDCCEKERQQLMICREKALQQDLKLDAK